jgi:hypothetical protein
MPTNDAAEPSHVCPGIGIHAIDIVQPPGIGIWDIVDMDAHQAVVNAALATKSSAETARNVCREDRSETMTRYLLCHNRIATTTTSLAVLVVALPPGTGLVAPFGSAIEPLIHSPQPVHSACVGGVGMIDNAVFERE